MTALCLVDGLMFGGGKIALSERELDEFMTAYWRSEFPSCHQMDLSDTGVQRSI